MKLYIAMYHYVRDLRNSRYPKIKGLDVAAFREQIAFFKRDFNFVTMEDVMDAASGNAQLPENALLLTFDDGYSDHYDYVFPILKEERVQGSFFIVGKTLVSNQLLNVNRIHYLLASADERTLLPALTKYMNDARRMGGGGNECNYPCTEELYQKYAVANRFDNAETIFIKRMLQTVLPEPVRVHIAKELFKEFVGESEDQLSKELYLNRKQLKTMKEHGMYIGVHGYEHYWLGNLPDAQMKKDIDQALDALDEFIDKKQWVMNFPYGNYNDGVLDYVRAMGACIGLTTKVRIAEIGKDSALLLPRLDCNDFPPKSENYKNMLEAHHGK